LKVDVVVDVVTAVLGGKVEVLTLTGPVNLNIPAGTQGGQTIRLRGKGMPSLQTKDQYGDLMAKINIQVPQNLSEKERLLYQQLADLRQN
jgi:curved DNA-binding protein